MEWFVMVAVMVAAAQVDSTEVAASKDDKTEVVQEVYEIPVVARQMHVRHSQFRGANGLFAQRLDPGLCRLAQRLAEEMARQGNRSHSTNLSYAENICVGTDGLGSVELWIGSSAHAANLLNGEECVGFGVCGAYSASLHGSAYDGPDIAVSIGGGGGVYRGTYRARGRWFGRRR